MSDKTTPIPPAIWKQVLDFLKSDKTGDIVLKVRRGTVKSAKITHDIDADESYTLEQSRASDLTPAR